MPPACCRASSAQRPSKITSAFSRFSSLRKTPRYFAKAASVLTPIAGVFPGKTPQIGCVGPVGLSRKLTARRWRGWALRLAASGRALAGFGRRLAGSWPAGAGFWPGLAESVAGFVSCSGLYICSNLSTFFGWVFEGCFLFGYSLRGFGCVDTSRAPRRNPPATSCRRSLPSFCISKSNVRST